MSPLLLTMGDPAGIGPEITTAAWTALRTTGPAFAVVGDPTLYEAAAPTRRIDRPADAAAVFPDALPVLPLALASPATPGRPDPANAPAILAAIDTAVRHAREGRARAVVTSPIAKHVLYDAGFDLPGHTEYLARLTAEDHEPAPRGPVMMLVGGGLRVALATIHLALADVPHAVSRDRLIAVAQVTARSVRRDFGVDRPRLVFAGLNPHAGEGGALGREEIEVINPAAQALRDQGYDVADATAADALFAPHARGAYDAVIAMYHDQGLIPVKTLDFDGGVNVTLGLPIVRTSPDHGTAFALAGQQRARADSVIAALRLADRMAEARARSDAAAATASPA